MGGGGLKKGGTLRGLQNHRDLNPPQAGTYLIYPDLPMVHTNNADDNANDTLKIFLFLNWDVKTQLICLV